MAVCAACGTENRDKAKFCKGCAQALVPLATPAQGVASVARGPACPACHAPNRRSATVCKSCGAALGASPSGAASNAGVAQSRRGWAWIVGPTLLVALGGAWWLQAQSPAAPPVPSTQQRMAQPVSASLQRVSVTTVTVAPPAANVPASVAQPASEAPPRPVPAKKEAKTAKTPTVRSPTAAERQSAPAATQTRTEPETASAAADASQRQAGTGESDRTPASAGAVDQLCAGSSNFIARDFCRVRACNDAARAGDPVCVRYRQMEEANRQRQGN